MPRSSFDPTDVGWRIGRSRLPHGVELWCRYDRTTGVYGEQGSGKTLDLLAPALLGHRGAELATFRTYATAAIVPMIAAPTNTQLPINRMRVGPARLCARRRFRACRDISAISETTLPVVISWHLLRGALPATCLAT